MASQAVERWADSRHQADGGSGFFSRAELPGRMVASGTEVRTVPSALYPTVASAVSAQGASELRRPLLVRILPGVYHEYLHITEPVVLIGAGKELPTIWGVGPDSITISGASAAGCALRRLRLCAESGCHALRVRDASPLIDGCELVGTSGEPVRGAPAGLDVKGATSRPVIRGCRISGHGGAGIMFGDGAHGLVAACDISRCACGVWLEGHADPLIWRNTLAGHRGAGVVVRATGLGCILSNAVLRNGAGGVLVESSRRCRTTIVQNRVWANSGCDLRQGPAQNGLAAGQAGALLLANTVGQQDAGPSASQGIELAAAWPKRAARSSAELLAAIQEAPSDRYVVIEIHGSLQLQEPLILDRPVILTGATEPSLRGDDRDDLDSSTTVGGELRGAPGESVVIVQVGAESSAFWRLTLTCTPADGSRSMAANCLEVKAGQPVLVDSELCASRQQKNATDHQPESNALTHTLWASGSSTHPVLVGCSMRGAQGSGVLLQGGASASLVKCKITMNHQGGVLLAEGSSLMAESCEISGNGHFGVVAGKECGSVLLGRTDLTSNASGSMWHCGGREQAVPVSSSIAWLDQCSLAGAPAASGKMASPAVVMEESASVALWDCATASIHGNATALRVDAASTALVAGDGPTLGWPGWTMQALSGDEVLGGSSVGQGQVAWLDVSGVSPPMQVKKKKAPTSPQPSQHPSRSASAGQGPQSIASSFSNWPSFKGRQTPQVQQQQRPTDAWFSSQGPQVPQATPSGYDREPTFGLERGPTTEQSPGFAETISEARPSSEEPSGRWSGEEMETETVVDDALDSAAAPEEDFTAAAAHAVSAAESEGGHAAWLKNRIQSGSKQFGAEDADRRTLHEILAMLAVKDHCKDVPDSVGLMGQIKPNDHVLLRGHTGRWIGMKSNGELICQAADRKDGAVFAAEFKGAALKNDCRVSFKLVEPAGSGGLWLGVTPSADVRFVQKSRVDQKESAIRFVVKATPGAVSSLVLSGMPAYLKSTANGKMVEVDGSDVRAKSSMDGTRQRIQVEKVPAGATVPPASEDFDLSPEEKAWVYLRGAQLALVDKQNLARFLSGHKPHCKELLKAYTRLWESEWRKDWRSTLELTEDSAPSSPASRQSSRSGSVNRGANSDGSRPRARSRGRIGKDWIMGMVGSVPTTPDDKSNGNLFVSALRSFFANAIRMSQLEADPVQRVIEAFADALVADQNFLSCFSSSMLPEKERKTYRTPDEVLFGLTYTTLMLNTDMHNKQVAQKMWDTKKFVGAGRDCGVTGGLMAEIFKCVQKEEL